MNRFFVAGFASLLLLVSLTVISYADPSWPEDLGVDVWNIAALTEEVRTETKVCEQLHQELEITHRCVSLRIAIAQNLLDGLISFEDAVRAFDDMNKSRPLIFRNVHQEHNGSTSDEQTARHVLKFVQTYASPDSQREQDLLHRWEHEISSAQATGGWRLSH